MDHNQVSDGPNHDHKESNMREIGVTVCVALFSDLDEANHWSEHNDIPKPAGEQVRSFSPENDRCDSDGEKQSDREHHLPNCQRVVWMRIENGEAGRPECFPDINHVSRERVFHTPEPRQRRNRASSAFLHYKCDDTRARREKEQRKLFEYETAKHSPLNANS